ncbi:hypothetical protein H311_03327, partial [Anncaliia algerae PRA109]
IEIEIDETHLFKRKYHKGNVLASEAIWIFGIYERISKKVYFEAVPKRDAQTLYKIISKKVRPNSIIYSDSWAGYSEIRKHFEVKSVNHKLYFVHPDDKSNHINNIERTWRTLKEDMRGACN